MHWYLLAAAGGLEVVFALLLRYSEGFSRPAPAAIAVVAMVASVALLAMAMRTLPAGTAYAVWTGIGAAGTLIAGIVFLAEPAGVARLLCAGLIVAGVAGLKLTS